MWDGASSGLLDQSDIDEVATVDVRAPAGEGEVAEHVIEGAVFEHHDDHVVDLLEVDGIDPLALINSHGSHYGAYARARRSAGPTEWRATAPVPPSLLPCPSPQFDRFKRSQSDTATNPGGTPVSGKHRSGGAGIPACGTPAPPVGQPFTFCRRR